MKSVAYFVVIFLLVSCGASESYDDSDFWEFKHVVEKYDRSHDIQELEFCNHPLSLSELDTLEQVLKERHTDFKREKGRILVKRIHVKDINSMWALDDELRSRINSENCPQYQEY